MSLNIDDDLVPVFTIVSIGFAYNLIYNLSGFLGLSWVDVPLDAHPPYEHPNVEDGVFSFFVAFFCLIPALYRISKNIALRLEKKEITKMQIKDIYIRAVCLYILYVIGAMFILPIIIPLVRL